MQPLCSQGLFSDVCGCVLCTQRNYETELIREQCIQRQCQLECICVINEQALIVSHMKTNFMAGVSSCIV